MARKQTVLKSYRLKVYNKSFFKIGHLKRCLLFFLTDLWEKFEILMHERACLCLPSLYLSNFCRLFLIWSLLEKILYTLRDKSVDWRINAIKLFRKLNAWLGYTIAVFTLNLNRPQRDKTYLRGFRQRETQTSTLGISLIWVCSPLESSMIWAHIVCNIGYFRA